MSDDIIYAISYGPDEVSIVETFCKQPWKCTCKRETDGVKCGYSAEEARQKLIAYYEQRVAFLKKCNTKEFLHDMGIYID